ncbi:MAG: tetratricopeptide repeat protein, partial [Alphaproteobacteria bacterium]|nr:tetratricopeptide repeat protein [Alphaproteobacteria bacterium]
FNQAAELVPSGHPDDTARYREQEAFALYRQGGEGGDPSALKQSIEIWHIVLQYRTRERAPAEWAMTKTLLGNALQKLGEGETGTASLEEAVETYNAALEVRDQAPLDWAMTENDLGAALERLGEREVETTHLTAAVAAYRAALEPGAVYYAALEEDARGRVSWMVWAGTENNLGAALQTLGERVGGTAELEGAVVAFRAALAEYTRDQTPLDWALTQLNLGNALKTLGEREGNTERFKDAVVAYQAALETCPRDRVPLQWALTENNLGVALMTLGAQDSGGSGTAQLTDAVTHFNQALQVRTRDRVPLAWAMTEYNLGMALKALGDREIGTQSLEKAAAAYRAVLQEYTPDRVPRQWAQTLTNLGNVLLTLGVRGKGAERLEEAVAAYRAAVQFSRIPVDLARAEFNMGQALVFLDRRAEALDCFQQSEAIFLQVGMPRQAEMARQWIARLSEGNRKATSDPAEPTDNPRSSRSASVPAASPPGH